MSEMKECRSCNQTIHIGLVQCWSCNGREFSDIHQLQKEAGVESDPESEFESASGSDFLLLSIDYVPGREIELAMGTVLGHGDAWFGTTRERVQQSRDEAIADLRKKAALLGADAVVGLTVNVSGIRGFWGISPLGQSAVVQATGTAVTLKSDIAISNEFGDICGGEWENTE